MNKIIQGSALKVLKTMPAESISCCISSPPYWALRDYGVEGQLGLEKTFEEYIDKLCTIYDEVKRVLRKDGTCFVNLGDTYNNSTPGGRDTNRWPKQSRNDHTPNTRSLPANLQTKSLCLIPQRFAIEMVNRGWILRNTIIWHKPNPMPSSAKDRFTVDFEYVYFFVKSKKYYFEPQYEPHSRDWTGCGGSLVGKTGWATEAGRNDDSRNTTPVPNPLGRNKRCVWTIPTEGRWGELLNFLAKEFGSPLEALVGLQRAGMLPNKIKGATWKIPTQSFPEAHFATYPERLVEPMIRAGCPEFICTKCGVARKKVFETEYIKDSNRDTNKTGGMACPAGLGLTSSGHNNTRHIGYTDCNCGAEFVPGIVWDPFAGSGTTLQVAARLGRNYGGSELKQEYIEMAEKRVVQGESGIPVKEQRQGQQPLFPKEQNG